MKVGEQIVSVRIRVSRVLLTVVSLAVLAASPAAAAVVCVPNIACDASCNSFQLTIQLAVDAAGSGDTVLVCPGTYAEVVTAGHGGVTPGAPGLDINKSLVLKSRDGAATTIIQVNGGHCLPTSCPFGPQQLLTLSASGVTIDGFTILETDATQNLITADGDAVSDNHVIQNNVIQNPTFDDANAGGGWGILLGGTAIDGADNNLITNNEISLNPDPEKQMFTFGVGFIGGGADPNNNNLISNNFIHDAGGGGFSDVNDTNIDVTNNTFEDNARYGWQFFGSGSGSSATGNSFTNSGRAGLEIRGGATGIVVQNNCFSKNGASPPSFVTTTFGGIRIADDSFSTTGSMISNNNFLGDNVPDGINDTSAASTNTDGQAENNYWGCGAGPGNVGCDTVTANVDFTPFLASFASGTPCTPTTTTTTTSTSTSTSTTTSTTTSTSTTTTTIIGSLNLTRATLRRESSPGRGNGSIKVRGDFLTPPAFTFPPPFTVRVQDGGAMDQSHTYTTCTSTAGRVKCSDVVGTSKFKADFQPLKSTPSIYRFKLNFLRLVLPGPFTPPVTVTLSHNGAVIRQDTIVDCRQRNSGLTCREF